MEEQKHTPGPIKGNCPTCGILCVIDSDNAAGNDNYYPVTNGLLERVSSLTKERKGMVEALRARMDGLEDYNNEYFFLESLLSKFEP